MKKIILILSFVFVILSSNAYAARFGGGKSFGQQRPAHHQSSPANPQHSRPDQRQSQQPPHQQPATPQNPPKRSFMSKVLPVLAGLSAGALLGSLLGGHGLGGAVGSILMMVVGALVVFFIVRKLFSLKKTESNFVPQQPFSAPTSTTNSSTDGFYQPAPSSYSQSAYEQPESETGSYAFNRTQDIDFNKEEFLRNAKITFIRMQNAYDHKNLTDIRNFTTPEVFGEIQMQLQERGTAANYTEVVQINALLLDEPGASNPSASVMFSGQIKEQQDASPVSVNEVWHFVKNNNTWLIAGIEQQK